MDSLHASIKKNRGYILLLLFVVLLISNIHAQIVYVDPLATGTGDGASWANAVNDLQAGIDLAATVATSTNSIQVWIKAGTYKATAGTDRSVYFQLKSHVGLYGGFSGSETTLTQRNIEANQTILSGDLGVPGDDSDNSYTAFTYDASFTGEIIIDGLTIQDYYDPNNLGGAVGIILANTSGAATNLVVSNCTFSNIEIGFAAIYGFVPYEAEFYSCKFLNNAGSLSKTFWIADDPLTIVNSQFIGNKDPVYVQAGSFTAINNTFYGNSGNVITLQDQSTPVSPTIINNIFWQNTGTDIIVDGNASTNLIAVNNLVEDVFTFGTNTISLDPQFLDAPNGDLRLSPCSPALDEGDNSFFPPSITTDLNGDPRIFNTIIDLGALENQVTPIGFSAVEIGPVQCAGGSDGSISVNGTGGTGSQLEYSIDGINFQSIGLFENLSADNYEVYIKDTGANCTFSENFNVSGPIPITFNISISTSPTMNTIAVQANGGNGSFTYSLDGTTFQTGNLPISTTGVYTIYVRDLVGCTVSKSYYITSSGNFVLFVDPGATGDGSGNSWNNAYTDLQAALDEATLLGGIDNPTEVWVRAGTYYPDVQSSTDRTKTVVLRDNVALLGGFAGTETESAQRDIENNLTILSGDIGVASDSTDNSYGLITVGSDVTNTATIDGWRLEGAFSLAVEPTNGAIHLTGDVGELYVKNCTFRYNLSNEGACIRTSEVTNSTSNVFIESSVFANNGFYTTSGYIGSALNMRNTATIYNCLFVDNKSGQGGAIYLENAATVSIINSTFYDNSAGNASVIRAATGVNIDVANSIFWNNSSVSNGQFSGGTINFSNNIIEGGSIQNNLNENPLFINEATYDLRIRHCSPGVDAGDDNKLPFGAAVDLLGNTRQFNTVDIGAYENQVTPIAISLVDLSNVTCSGLVDGSIEVSASGGTGAALQFSIDGTNFSTNTQFTALAAGNYTITVLDSGNGCEVTESYVIEEPDLVTVSASATDISCNGADDGFISGTVMGGVAPYDIYLNGGLVTQVSGNFQINNLTTNTYTLSVEDTNGCQITFSSPLIISEPAALDATISSVDVLCHGESTGEITTSVTGGNAPYEYSIDGTNFQSGNVFSSLIAGNYTVSVRDANGCATTIAETVLEPAIMILVADVVSDPKCSGVNDGSISVSASGGSGNYEFNINGGQFGTSADFQGLSAGSYVITVRDENGCETQLTEIINNQFTLTATTTSTDPLCHGASNGTITLNATGGVAPYEYIISGSTSIQSSATFSGLTAGTYVLRAFDANGCQASVTVTLTDPQLLTVQDSTDNLSCNGALDGEVEVLASGGTMPYEYSLDGSNFQTSPDFMGLIAGTYTVTTRDSNGCLGTVETTISEPALLTIAVDQSDNDFTVSASGGVAPYEFSVDGINYQSVGSFNDMPSGTYTFLVRDANGCEAESDSFSFVLGAEKELGGYQIYPNPAATQIYLHEIEFHHLVMFDLNGKKVLESMRNESLDLTTLRTGVFVLHFYNQKGEMISQQRIIKE